MKKLLSTIMAVVMLLSLVPMAVAEEGETAKWSETKSEKHVAQVGDMFYETLADAVASVPVDGTETTITLLNNAEVENYIAINGGKNIVLDLNGHDVVHNGNYLFDVYNAKFHVTGEGTLFENVKDGYAPIIARGSATDTADYTVITIDKGDYTGIFVAKDAGNGYHNYGLVINMFGTIDMGAVADGYHYSGMYVNGTNTVSDGNVMTINLGGATIKNCEATGIYAAGYAKWNITNSSITSGNTGIEIRAGELTVNGATVVGNGVPTVVTPNGNGSTTEGAGIAVAQHTTKLPIKVTINSGDISGYSALYQSNPEKNDDASVKKVSVAVNGGTFKTINRGTCGVHSENNCVTISGGAFTDLASAVKYATDGATITLAGDANGNGVVFAEGRFATKGLTIDFNGHTYSVGGVLVGSTGTGTNAFQLLKGNKITFKNGTIAGVTEGTKPAEDTPNWHGAPAIVIQNYCDLTLDNMTVTGGDETVYTMSNNNGNVTIKDTTINKGGAKGYGYGPFAFDVCRYSEYPAVGVTVTGDSVINGDVEVSGTIGEGQSRQLTINSGMFNGKFVVANEPDNITISGGAFNVAPDAKYLAEGMIVVPGVKDAPYSVQPSKRTNEEENTETEVKVDGDKVTVTVTDKTTGTTTETVTDTTTGAKTETKTENKVEGNVTTKTETVTEKNAAGETTKATETVTTEKTENGGKTTVVTKKDTLNKTETTEVTGVTAPTTASDVTLDVKNTTNVAVNKASMTALKGDTVKDVVIETKDATLKLDKTAVKTMESKVEDNDKMKLDITVTEEKNATTTEIEKVKVEVTAKNEAGQNVFPKDTENTNGLINITIPYNGNAKYLDLWYIAANASATYMGRFPVVNGFVSFDVKHFSQYDLIPVASSGSSVIKTGAGSSAASTTQTVTTDLTPGSITKVTVDGKVVDAKYYTVSGSNVTFTAEFLKTLKNGSHTVTVENATKIAKGVFTVNNPTTAQSPTTADAGIALYAGMAIASVMGTGVVFTSRKRKNH